MSVSSIGSESRFIVEPDWLIPVSEGDPVLEQHALVVERGRIAAIGPAADIRSQFADLRVHRLPGHALIPGLINAHTHAAMTLMRGLADDLPLMTWLNDHIWPAEKRWVSEEFVADGTRHAAAEMLRGGTTCFNDMYFYPEVTGRVCADIGLRAVVGLIVIDFPSGYAADADGYLSRALAVHDEFRSHPLIRTAFAPHAPYSVSDGPLERIRTLADQLEIPVHIHVHETRDEIRQGIDTHGDRPIARLDRLGLVNPSLVGVHMVHLEDAEIARWAEAGAQVVHCPESNLKLASGMPDMTRLLAAGIDVALGADGAASNNDLDLFGEMRSAALLAKGVSGDAAALPAATALRMATINGAKALGLVDEIGSLEVGKAADMVAIDLSSLESQPVYHPLSQLVYAASRSQVQQVWVAGRHLLKDGVLTSMDEDKILERAGHWRAQMAENA